MTTRPQTQAIFNQAVVDIVTDLSRAISAEERYQHLLVALRQIFHCDAAALLQLHSSTPSSDTVLEPLAVSGLSEDTLGRRFAIAEHPRLARILASSEPVRFVDNELPDPYDGLVDGNSGALAVHDCLGAALHIDGKVWGVLTLDALQSGTFDRLEPLALRTFIRLAEASVKAVATIQTLREQVAREHQVSQALQAAHGQRELIGKSSALQTLRHAIDTVAGSDLVVLILGETGVGKELVAQQLHARSARSEKPLVYVNCAALPEALAESELFGHCKGAFTGASAERSGKFELADGGTLLLDEVGELPLLVQAKLLRVLQSGEIQRLGSDRALRVDVRVLAATNRELQQEVAAGRFRADLYHRLSVFPLTVPPLRERGRDVLALAGYFLEHNQQRLNVRNVRLSNTAKQTLLDYDWPGNVRELEHVMSRAALLATAEQGRGQRWITIETQHLGLPITGSTAAAVQLLPSAESTATFDVAVDSFRKAWLQQLLQQHDGNLAAAARAAGIDRSNFFRLLKRLQLR